MKVLNLRCANGHGFEGWFGSDDDFMEQNGRGLVACPLCADSVVSRMPSAPRLNLSGAKAPQPTASAAAAVAPEPQAADLQTAWLSGVRKLMASTENVGPRFAEEARRIHYGETPQRGIRGQATAAERETLRNEGIETVAIPVPPGFAEPLQ